MGVVWNALAVERDRSSFVEDGPIVKVYISGVAYAEVIDGLLHAMCFIKRPGPDGVECVLGYEIIMPEMEVDHSQSRVNGARKKAKRALDG